MSKTVMTKKERSTQEGLVPRLRFPEFVGTGAWVEKKLGDQLDTIVDNRGKTPPTCDYGIPLIEINAILSTQVDYSKIKKYVTRNTYDSWFRKYLQDNDILFSTVGKTGLCALYKEKNIAAIAQNVIALRFSKQYNSEFMLYLLTEEKNHRYIKSIEMQAVQPSIKVTQFIKLSFYVAELPEQQRIANCLSSLDTIITAQEQKIKKLEDHKKALMQKLFPKQGESVPALRFKEFLDGGEWEEKRLGDVSTFLKGKGISKLETSIDGKLLCIRYGELYTLYGEVITEVFTRTDLDAATLVLSQQNDVLIPSSGETKIDIATATCIKQSGVALGGDLNIVRTKQNGSFLSYYINGVKKRDIAKIAQGDTVVHLYNNQIQNLFFRLPSLPEQQRIADCLTSLDELIAAHRKKLSLLKEHKKGLMQGLFPVGRG